MNFEKKLTDLEKIVESMEEGELSLDQSLKKFEQGVKLSRECQEALQKAELQVQKLLSVDEDGNAEVEDFEDVRTLGHESRRHDMEIVVAIPITVLVDTALGVAQSVSAVTDGRIVFVTIAVDVLVHPGAGHFPLRGSAQSFASSCTGGPGLV